MFKHCDGPSINTEPSQSSGKWGLMSTFLPTRKWGCGGLGQLAFQAGRGVKGSGTHQSSLNSSSGVGTVMRASASSIRRWENTFPVGLLGR